MKILSIHQPNFIPWLGFFDKIFNSDIFVILDIVQYPRGKSVANRNKIKGNNNNIIELVIPISKPKGLEGKVNYREVLFAETNWNKKILKSIELNYCKHPYFDDYFSEIKDIFFNKNFCEMNIEFIYFIVNLLDIKTEIVLQSELENTFAAKNDLIITLCNHFKAEVYLSGSGASKYNNKDLLNKNNINLTYQEYDHPIYSQFKGEFIPYLSVLDLIFNQGPKSKNLFEERRNYAVF